MESLDNYTPGDWSPEDELEEIIKSQHAAECRPAGSAADQSSILEIQQLFEDEAFRTL